MGHAESFSQNRVEILVELLNFLHVAFLESQGHILIKLVDFTVQHLLDDVLSCLGGAHLDLS